MKRSNPVQSDAPDEVDVSEPEAKKQRVEETAAPTPPPEVPPNEFDDLHDLLPLEEPSSLYDVHLSAMNLAGFEGYAIEKANLEAKVFELAELREENARLKAENEKLKLDCVMHEKNYLTSEINRLKLYEKMLLKNIHPFPLHSFSIFQPEETVIASGSVIKQSEWVKPKKR